MDSIGEIVALRGAATAQGQDGVRELAVGSPVFSGDVLSTGQDSNLEVRFVDDTVLAQGPGASLTVDNYVFDPQEPSASAMLMNLSKGTFRLVTGSIAKDNPEGIALSSPLATIGIRGTGADLDIGADGVERYGIFQYDGLDLVITTARGTVFLTNQGLVVDVNPDGSLGAPRPYTPDELQMFQTLAPLSAILELGRDDGQAQGGDGEGDGGDDGQAQGPQDGDPDGGQQGEGEGEGPGDGPGEGPGQEPADPFANAAPPDVPTQPGAAGGFVSSVEPPASGDQPSGGQDDDDVVQQDGQDGDDGGDGDGDGGHGHPGHLTATEGPDLLEYMGAEAVMIYGLGGDDTIYGGPAGDGLYGGTGNDKLYGLGGDDFLEGGPGSDYLDGGDGTDTASFEDSAVLVQGFLNGATPAIFGDDTLVNIENIYGSAYNDSLNGDSYANLLRGKDGNDILVGNAGNDTLYGDEGTDYLLGDAGDDLLYGGTGNDTLEGGVDDDVLYGGDGDDSLVGGDGDDLLHGGAGMDSIAGGAGEDTLSYADSDDGVNVTLSDAGPVTLTGGHAQQDTISGIEHVIGSDHIDSLVGNSQGNLLSGGDSMDSLVGNGGADTLIGGDGNDVLHGGLGGDSMSGGDGHDTFYWGSDAEGHADAVVADFVHGEDSLWFNKIGFGFGSEANPLDAAHFATLAGTTYGGTGAGFGNNDPGFVAVELLSSGGTYQYSLYFDDNGDTAGGETFLATVFSEGELTNTDFVISATSPSF
jgi:Ca2+-binding RTX toxin-like protein